MLFDSRLFFASLAGPGLRPLLGLPLVLLMLGSLAAETSRRKSAVPLPQVWTGRMRCPRGSLPGRRGILRAAHLPGLDRRGGRGPRTALEKDGQAALRNAMYSCKVKGWIRIGKFAATDAVVIRVLDLPDGHRRVRFYSDHPLRLYDKTDPAGSTAHPFAYLELVADASGKGSGTLVASASLAIADDELRMESAGLPVIQVYDVTTDTPPPPSKAPGKP